MRTLLVLLVGVLVLASCENTTLAPLPTEEVVQVPAVVVTGPVMARSNIYHRFSCPAYDGSGTCSCDNNGINAMDLSNWAWTFWGFGGNGPVGMPGDGDGVSGRK